MSVRLARGLLTVLKNNETQQQDTQQKPKPQNNQNQTDCGLLSSNDVRLGYGCVCCNMNIQLSEGTAELIEVSS